MLCAEGNKQAKGLNAYFLTKKKIAPLSEIYKQIGLVAAWASHYFLPMGIGRLSVEDAKDFWFKGDLTVYTWGYDGVDQVIALPKIEVERGLKYLRKLQNCRTYKEAQDIYIEFSKDQSAPKLIPRIIDPMENLEFTEDIFSKYLLSKGIAVEEQLEYVDKNLGLRDLMNNSYAHNWLPHEYDNEYRELVERIVFTDVPFVWHEAPPYLDDNYNFAACRDIQIWTDAWIPKEISEAIGTPDLGYGIDYSEAENLYKNRDLFIQEFLKYGIKTEIDHPELRELVGY